MSLTLPATVTSGERSFSKLKLMITYLRSTMIEEILVGRGVRTLARARAQVLRRAPDPVAQPEIFSGCHLVNHRLVTGYLRAPTGPGPGCHRARLRHGSYALDKKLLYVENISSPLSIICDLRVMSEPN